MTNLYNGNKAPRAIKYFIIIKIPILIFDPSSLTNLPSGHQGSFFLENLNNFFDKNQNL